MKSVWVKRSALVALLLGATTVVAAAQVALIPTPQASSAVVVPSAPAAFDTHSGHGAATSYVSSLDRSSSCTQIMEWAQSQGARVVDVDRGMSLDREDAYAACMSGVTLKLRTAKHTAVVHDDNPSEKVASSVAAVSYRSGGSSQPLPAAPAVGDPRTVVTITAS